MKLLKNAILILLALFVLAGCTSGPVSSDPSNEPDSTNVPSEDTPEPTPDINSFDYTLKTVLVQDLEGKYKTQGRSALIEYRQKGTTGKVTGLDLYYTAGTFEFNCYCEGDVEVVIDTSPTQIGGNNMYYNVYVDGVKQGTKRPDFKIVGAKSTHVILASGLERGFHTFVIERQNEAERGNFCIYSITLNGEIVERPQDKDLFIEFIGDSITTGYGNLFPNLADGDIDTTNLASNVYQDGSLTYAALTAKNLNADYSIVAQQGIGVTSGYYEHTMLQTYKMTSFQGNNKTEWSFPRKADVVVINMGTNDNTMATHYGKITRKQMQEGFVSFLKLVREVNPDSKIVWAYGMMDTSAIKEIKAAIEEVGGENAGIYFVQLIQNYEGGNGHPTAAAHKQSAEILTSAIKDILNGN